MQTPCFSRDADYGGWGLNAENFLYTLEDDACGTSTHGTGMLVGATFDAGREATRRVGAPAAGSYKLALGIAEELQVPRNEFKLLLACFPPEIWCSCHILCKRKVLLRGQERAVRRTATDEKVRLLLISCTISI